MAIFDLSDPRNVVEQLRTLYPTRTISFTKIDVRHRQDFEKAFQLVVERFGRIDGIVNGAGIVRESSAEDVIGVNVIGVINGTQIALDHMSIAKSGQGGQIVNIASALGLDVYHMLPIYSASKHAVVGYTRSMADEKFENKFGVKFVTICPGFTSTPLVDGIDSGLYVESLKEDLPGFVAKRGIQTWACICLLQRFDATQS